jgi:hypothetical protein
MPRAMPRSMNQFEAASDRKYFPGGQRLVDLRGLRTEACLRFADIPSKDLSSQRSLVEPWTKVIGHPMSADFYEVCSLQLPKVTATYARNSIKCAAAVLGDHDVADVFFFATRASIATSRRRRSCSRGSESRSLGSPGNDDWIRSGFIRTLRRAAVPSRPHPSRR